MTQLEESQNKTINVILGAQLHRRGLTQRMVIYLRYFTLAGHAVGALHGIHRCTPLHEELLCRFHSSRGRRSVSIQARCVAGAEPKLRRLLDIRIRGHVQHQDLHWVQNAEGQRPLPWISANVRYPHQPECPNNLTDHPLTGTTSSELATFRTTKGRSDC